MTTRASRIGLALACAVLAMPMHSWSHGDVNPQPVDTTGLAPLGDAWRSANPYRGNELAVKIGKSAYNQQCARCHGLGPRPTRSKSSRPGSIAAS